MTEAGGKITDSEGKPFTLSTRNVVASNGVPDVHDSMIALIAQAGAAHLRL